MISFFASIGTFVLIPFRFLRSHLKKTIAAVIVLFFAWSAYAVTRPSQPVYITAKAERSDIRQTVEAVGTLISEKDLELQFPTIDVVSSVSVKEGQSVKAGQQLAALRSGSLSAGVASASANVQSALAQLRQLEEGARPEDIAIYEAQVANKRAALEAAKSTLTSTEKNLIEAQSQLLTLRAEASTALVGQVNSAQSTAQQYLAGAKTAIISVQGVYNANDVQDAVVKGQPAGYESMQFNMRNTLTVISALQSNSSVTDYQSALSVLRSARAAVSDTSTQVSSGYDIMSVLPLTSYFTNTSRETNKTSIATQKSSVQSALSSVDAALKSLQDAAAGYDTRIAAQQASIVSLSGTRDRAQADINTYQTSLAIDEANLALKKAPARATDIQAARARVSQAQADLARASAQYRDTILIAPVDGVVTKVNVKTGEMRPSTEPAVTMLGNSPYRIEMFVSEVDIPRVKLSQTGSIKLDAYRDTLFALTVSEIDTASTNKDGVSKYRIKLDFVYPHTELKVGMTGDGEVTTGFKANVVSVPLRAVLEKADGTKIVRILKNVEEGTIEERTVTTGLDGEGGNVEVQGVLEGETVIVLEKK